LHSYDDGVYFAAAIVFVGGRIPYSDFLLLHPPGILYVLSPFAALASVFGDANAFATARLAFMALGAVNAGLVTLVAGRMGRRAALFAGSLYVVWQIAANVERTTWLVAPQNTLLLLALLVLGRPAPDGLSNGTDVRRAAAAGGLLGLGFGIQLWGVVPLAIAVLWQVLAARHRRGHGIRPALACLVGGGVAAAVVWLPFALVAGPQAVRQVVIDQLGRPAFSGSMVERVQIMEGLRIAAALGRAFPATVVVAIYIAIALVVASIVAWAAWRRGALRPSATLFAVQAAVLFILPPFHHYAGWLAPAGAVAIGGSFDTLAARLRGAGRASSVVVVLYSFGIAALLISSVSRPVGTRIETARLETAIAGARCVTADAPVLLILTGALQRDLQNGCPLVLDPAGTSFDLDRGSSRPRPERPEYQEAMESYFGGSDAALFARLGRDGLSPATWEAIGDRLPIAMKFGRVRVLVRDEHDLVP
jgi:hypothetical protein